MMSLATKLLVLDETSERGVHNPRIIDLIALDSSTDIVTLTMIEFRPWETTPEQIEQLEEKFNNYLDYVLDGYFVEQYPQYSGKRVQFCLQYSEPPAGRTAELVSAFTKYAQSVGIEFSISPLDANTLTPQVE